MTTKTTLRHTTSNGETFTRTTARNYTHVLVGTLNIERARAENDARLQKLPKAVEEKRRELEKTHECYRRLLDTGIGGRTKNWNGFVVEVDQFHIDCATRGLNDYGTINEQVDALIVETTEAWQKRKEFLDTAEPAPSVFSWHSSRELASKAAAASHYSIYDFTVEEING